MTAHAGSLAKRIVESLRARGPMVTHEIAYQTGGSLQSVQRLMPALEQMGQVEIERRIGGPSGGSSIVWKLKEKK